MLDFKTYPRIYKVIDPKTGQDKFDPTTYPISHYQLGVLDAWVNSTDNLIVSAVPGSGKTTTLTLLAQYIERGLFLAFNAHIAKELNEKLQGTGMQAQTINSLGFAILRNTHPKATKVESNKYRYIAGDFLDLVLGFNQESTEQERAAARAQLSLEYREELRDRFGDDKRAKYEFNSQLAKLIDMARVTLSDWHNPDVLMNLCLTYDISLQESDLILIPLILQMGLDEIETIGRIDFNDQLYVPVYRNLPPVKKYPVVAMDEAQDFSKLDLAIISLVVGGRVIVVGDENQAMYSFRGADVDSFQNVGDHFNCRKLPLSVCYRCPSSHLDLARHIVPHIENRANCPPGQVITLKELDEIREHVQEGDLILCRLTAPLINLAVQFIKFKMPARLRGQELGKNLTSILDKIEKMKGFEFRRVGYFLDQYQTHEVEKLQRRKGSEQAILTLMDKIEALNICASSFDVYSIAELKSEIEALFTNERKGIILSTVHRAKGDEAKNVFLIRPDKLPLAFASMSESQAQQEQNIALVALTRAMENLYIVQHEGKGLDISKLHPVGGIVPRLEATDNELEPDAPHFTPDVPAILSDKLGAPVTVAEPAPANDAPYYELIQEYSDMPPNVVQQSSSKPKWTLDDFKECAIYKSELYPGLWSIYERTPQGNKYLLSYLAGHDNMIYKPREWVDLPTLPADPAPVVDPAPTVDSSEPEQLPLLAEAAPMPPTHNWNIPTPKDATRAGGMIIRHTATSALTGLIIGLYLTLPKG